jgi:antitoxin VapB
MSEFESKQQQLQNLVQEYKLDALLLQRVSSFAWATCGASSYINTAATNGTASLLFAKDRRYLITNNIEAPRFENEEGLAAQGWEFKVNQWHTAQTAIADLTGRLKVGADNPFPNAVDLTQSFSRLRAKLLPEEGMRYKKLARWCAEAMNDAIRSVRPGMTEYEIAAVLGKETQARGVQPIVNLIAVDDRVYAYRHPLPTTKQLKNYAMLVLCGRKWGLVCSLTRLIHFGKLPDDLRRKAEAVAHVDATFIAHTKPGVTLETIFKHAVECYQQNGFGDQWQFHHQGGATGYEPREYNGTPTSADVVSVGQAFAWNPSIAGTKSEDTILVGEKENEVITKIEGWPTISLKVNGQMIERPKTLEL